MKKEEFFELAVKQIVGETSEKEKELIHEQLQINEDYAALYIELETYWNKSEHYDKEFSLDLADAFKKVIKGITLYPEIKKRRVTLSKAWKVAASVILLIGLTSLLYLKFYSGSSYEQVYYSGENTKEILLPDSSKVNLNRESKLMLASNFNQHKRKVKLEGEGFFNVSKIAEKPFIIKTQSTITKVLGTSFNLKEKDKKTTINVSSGKVWFSSKKNHLILSKGDAGMYSEDSKLLTQLDKCNPNAYAWVTGKLIFDDTKLNEVFETISSTYNIEFIFSQNLNDSGIRFAGQFDHQSVEDVLNILALTLNLQINKNEEQKYHVKSMN